jgi:hypothetical protein
MKFESFGKKTMTERLGSRHADGGRLGSAACSGREGTGGVHWIAWMVERARAGAGHSDRNPFDSMETNLSGAQDGR